jgi:DNA-binding protein H-NS
MPTAPALPVDGHTPAQNEAALTPADVFGTGPEAPHMLSRRERAAVLARIEALMEYWGITIDDLSADASEPPAAIDPTPRPVKYRHPATGETWDGQGPHPDWLRRALLQEGLRVDELRPAVPPQS